MAPYRSRLPSRISLKVCHEDPHDHCARQVDDIRYLRSLGYPIRSDQCCRCFFGLGILEPFPEELPE